MRRQILAFLALALVFGCANASAQCNNMAAPVLSDTPVETAQTLKGTGTPLVNGCTARITIWDFATASAGAVQLPIEGSGQVTPDGKFTVTLATGLQGGHMIEVREWLNPGTAQSAKPAKPASAKTGSAKPVPAQSAPQYLSSGQIRVGFCSEQLKIIAVPQLTAPILAGQPTIAGIAGVPSLPGCTAEITLRQAADLVPAYNSVNNSNGTFSITPAAAISGDPIIAREDFITPSGAISGSSVSSVPVAVQNCSTSIPASTRPTVNANLLDTAKVIMGQAAQPPLAACIAKVRAWRYEMGQPPTRLGESATVANAAFTIPALTEGLAVGQLIELQEVILNGAGTVLDPPPTCSPLSDRTSCLEVHDSEPWGRLKAYFTGGLLLSQDQGSFFTKQSVSRVHS
jgi:hypothetical protein